MGLGTVAALIKGMTQKIEKELAQEKTAITKLTPAATSSDIGKALIVKTVADGKPTSYEYGEAGGGSDIDDTAGAGDTDKVWSADKTVTEIQQIIVSGGVPIDDTAGKADTNKLWSAGKVANLLDYVRTVTPSKNLNVTPYLQTQEVNGLTFTTNEDNSVTVSGTASANTPFPADSYNSDFRWILPAGTYVLSGGKDLNKYIKIKLFDSKSAQNDSAHYSSSRTDKGQKFTIASDMYALVQVYIANGQSLSEPITFYPQVELGETQTSYASPWPAVSESSIFDDIDERLDDLESADAAFDERLEDDEADIDTVEAEIDGINKDRYYNKEKFSRTGNLIQFKPVVGSTVNMRIDFESVEGFNSITFTHCGENLIDINSKRQDGYTETYHGITGEKTDGYVHVSGTEDTVNGTTLMYFYLSTSNYWLPKGHYAMGYGMGLAAQYADETSLILQREFVTSEAWQALQCYATIRAGNRVDFDYPLMLVVGDESPRYYKAFEGEKVTVSLPSTVYGGWIDINNSVLHITKTVADGELVPVTETTVDLDPITLTDIVGINTLYSVDGIVSAQGTRQLDFVKDYQPSVADFFLDNDYLQTKIDRIKELMYGTVGTGDTFFFITDIHNECNRLLSFPVIREIAKQCKIPRLFCGGDVADGLYNRMTEVYDLLEHCYNGEIHYTMGNHEWMSHTTGDELAFWSDMGKKDQIGNTDRHYYYVDNPQQKIRYVVMSSCAEDENGDSWDWGYEQDQRDWIQNVALDVESGWGIILFTHIAYMIDWETSEKLTEPNFTPVETILNNYSGDGEIIAVIAGHAHCDGVFHTSAGIPIIVTTCDKGQAYLSRTTGDADMDSSIRIINTPSEQAFDVVVLDRENKEINMVRIGCKAWNNVDGVIDQQTPYLEERVISYDRS